MKFVADESVDQHIVTRLREEGHSIQYIVETGPGASDRDVLELARREGSILLTADKDFGELVFRQGRVTEGVMFIRLAGQSQENKAKIVSNTIKKHGEELLKAFSVITPGGIRIRKPFN